MKENDLFSNGAEWETDEQMYCVCCGRDIVANVHATVKDEDYGEALAANMRLIKEAPFMFNLLRNIEIFVYHYSDKEILSFIKDVAKEVWKMRLRAKVEPGMKRLAEKKEKREKEAQRENSNGDIEI